MFDTSIKYEEIPFRVSRDIVLTRFGFYGPRYAWTDRWPENI